MSFELNSLIFAENAVTDARGYLTIVGYNPVAWVVAGAPGLVSLTAVATLDESISPDQVIRPGAAVDFTPTVVSPSGRVLVAGTGRQIVTEMQSVTGGPILKMVRLVLVMRISFTTSESGEHAFKLSLMAKGQEPLQVERSLFVHQTGASSPK